jgi:hypothetical protein
MSRTRAANFSYKTLDSKYFRLCQLDELCFNYSAIGKTQNKCFCSNKVLFIKQEAGCIWPNVGLPTPGLGHTTNWKDSREQETDERHPH